jgi:ABC-type branched-subunit amino acid transport system substrate-binding protein
MRFLLAAALALAASAGFAQTIKIGFITSYSGLNGNLGPYMERAVRLYIKEHQKELPPGVKIELITRDDTGPNPDKAKQLAQELIVRDHVNFLAGVIFTPNALAIAPLVLAAGTAGLSMVEIKASRPYKALVQSEHGDAAIVKSLEAVLRAVSLGTIGLALAAALARLPG